MPHPLVSHCQMSLWEVYIGRASAQCIWGNPYSIYETQDRMMAIDMYERWLLNPKQTEIVFKAKRELRGKRLACWCAPKACHGDILARVANESHEDTERRRRQLGLRPGLNVFAEEFVPLAKRANGEM
ncbi:hypothetical protein K440DRAFT_646120 [Wilcoxina mikolae CBS 423.85]|nr:hypothetical protein K440DRAFT_646120 [Wilcoxina mikolae CBS 423.85]